MVNVTKKFMQQLYDDQRNYLVRIVINLADTNQTVLTLNNENIWGFSPTVEDAVSADEELQIGTAIINKCSFTINNIYGTYSAYDFKDAKVFLTVGLDVGNNTDERIKKGTFYVDTADYNDTFIALECLDGMCKLEKPYKTSAVTFPATADYVVQNICTACGVINDTPNFPNKSFIISNAPDKDTCTYREVLSWVAQICGCFARFNSEGHLELKWYDRQSLEDIMDGLDGGVFDSVSQSRYTTGDTADGGTFNPWNTGYEFDAGSFNDMIQNVHLINSAYSQSMSVDDVVVTGVRILVKTKDTDNTDVIASHVTGTEGYVIEISENPFITEANVATILSYLGTQLVGLTFRKANLSIPSDPSFEAGDVAIYFDKNGNYHPILVSRTTFITGDAQTIVSSAQTPARNSAERYSAETKNYVATQKQIRAEKTARETMYDDLQEQMANMSGLYYTEVEDPQTHAVTVYYHNKQDLEESDIQIVISDVGITVTDDGGDNWYGLTVDGNLIASILSVDGVNARWINTGAIQVSTTEGGVEKILLRIDCDTGTLQWDSANSSMTANGTLSCSNANISGVVTAGSGSQIGEMKAQVNSNVPCFYSGDRVNYNVDEEGICIESNGNFGASGNSAFWSRTGLQGDSQIHMFEWTNANPSSGTADSSFHLRTSHGTRTSNQTVTFNVDSLTGNITSTGNAQFSGNIQSGNRAHFNGRDQSGFMVESYGAMGGGGGTAYGTSANWWEMDASGNIKCAGELVSEKRINANSIQGYVSIGQCHSNTPTNNAICVWQGTDKFTVQWDSSTTFAKRGTTSTDFGIEECTGYTKINTGLSGSDSGHAIDVITQVDGFSQVQRFYVTWGGYVYAISTNHSSDERYKDIKGSYDYKDLFMSINPVEFTWKNSFIQDNTAKHLGVGAQTLKAQLKKHNCENLSLVSYDDKNDMYAVNYTELMMLSLPIVQEHERKIIELERKIDELQKRCAC